MSNKATQQEIDHVITRIHDRGLRTHVSRGKERTVIGVLGVSGITEELREALSVLPGVDSVVRVTKPYKLASREFHPDDTIVKVGDLQIGGRDLAIIAGPCAVESREQVLEVARRVKAAGATMMRGGAFKPRTSPYSFQGLGEDGLQLLAEARRETGLPIVTEVMEPGDVPLLCEYADVLQVGARNMQNFPLLHAVGRVRKPVLLKRGLSGTIEEWLQSAEYILSNGNFQVMLCERGIRTFETAVRNTLDLSCVPLLKRLTHLPVIADPSHGTGKWYLVKPMALAAVAAGADGIIVEVHPSPETALSDGPQSLTPDSFDSMMEKLVRVADVVGRRVRQPMLA